MGSSRDDLLDEVHKYKESHKFKRNMMLNIYEELIKTAENSLLKEFMELLENELTRSNLAIAEDLEEDLK